MKLDAFEELVEPIRPERVDRHDALRCKSPDEPLEIGDRRVAGGVLDREGNLPLL